MSASGDPRRPLRAIAATVLLCAVAVVVEAIPAPDDVPVDGALREPSAGAASVLVAATCEAFRRGEMLLDAAWRRVEQRHTWREEHR